MRHLLAVVFLGPALAAAGTAAAAPERIRGTVLQATPTALVVASRDGGNVTLVTNGDTHYAAVVPASLDAVRPGDFVGTAAKGPNSFLVALELVIFPASMRGIGEGHYGWDPLPDTTAGGGTTASSMTNGSVRSATDANGGNGRTNTSMTNGTVRSGRNAGGGRTLVLSYNGGSSTVLVPPTATIVRIEPGTAALVRPGAKVFITADETGNAATADAVVVGEGVTPPM